MGLQMSGKSRGGFVGARRLLPHMSQHISHPPPPLTQGTQIQNSVCSCGCFSEMLLPCTMKCMETIVPGGPQKQDCRN